MTSSELSLVHRTLPARRGAPPHPALVVLHGRGADELDLLPIAEMLDPRLFVISVRAPFRLFPGWQWYELLDRGAPEPASFAASQARLERFLDEITGAYPIARDGVWLLGFSQGAMMSGTVTLRRPERVAGTVMLSGYLPFDVPPPDTPPAIRGKPFFVAHGTADPILPLAMGRAARLVLEAAGADVTYHEYPMAHQVALEEIEDLVRWFARYLPASQTPDAAAEEGR